MYFHVGVHQPADARHFDRSFVSINRIRDRKSAFPCNSWIMDSGAFTEVSKYGGYRTEPEDYAREIERWGSNGVFLAAVTQDYMCEPFILAKTGMTVREHQRLTIARYMRIRNATSRYVMPVLQGYTLSEYLDHLDMYRQKGLIIQGQRVGVGSICKRNSNLREIENVLLGIKGSAPSLKLHGFGVKTTALKSEWVWNSLFSADSMAWSFAARRGGRNANDPQEGVRFEKSILSAQRTNRPKQLHFL